MNEKLYITKKQIVEAYSNGDLQQLFDEKIKLLKQVEDAKKAKKSLLEMLKNPSKIDMLLKMLQDNDK